MRHEAVAVQVNFLPVKATAIARLQACDSRIMWQRQRFFIYSLTNNGLSRSCRCFGPAYANDHPRARPKLTKNQPIKHRLSKAEHENAYLSGRSHGAGLEGIQVVTVYESGRPPDILLIDDNIGDAKLVEIAFRKTRLPAHVISAGSAEAGLDLLQMQDDDTRQLRPDLVFLDLNLPSMHGLTFLDLMKSDPALTAIPVLVLSSSSAPNDIAASYSRHANGFVTKPSSLDGYLAFAESISEYWFGLRQLPPNAK